MVACQLTFPATSQDDGGTGVGVRRTSDDDPMIRTVDPVQ